MAKGYWLVRGNILNLEEYSKYIDLAGPIIKKYDGIFLARGGQQEEFEITGYERSVLIEFKSYDAALKCYKSEEYQTALQHVKNSSKRIVSIVEGII